MPAKKRRRSRSKSRPNRKPPVQKKPIALKTADEFFALSERMQERYLLVLEAVGLVRGWLSLTKAMKQLKLTRVQVDRFARSAFRKGKNGRYVAKAYDHLLRVVTVISEDGLREVATRDSRQASKAGRHSAAVDRYFQKLQTGERLPLAEFQDGYIVDGKGERIPLLTDPERLEEMGSSGMLTFESLYARSL